MFEFFRKRRTVIIPAKPQLLVKVRRASLEGLEGRRLLSGSHGGHGGGFGGGFGGGHGGGFGGGGGASEIAFSLLPSAVQTGLTSLASTDGYAAPTATSSVYLGNRDGVETYSIRETGTGTTSTLTVDSTGAAVTAPTKTTTTFGAITTAAVTSEFTAIASALSLTAPASTDSVTVLTTASGAATYRISLASTTTSSSGRTHSRSIMVDSSGNPVGNERVPLSVLSTAIQNGLTGAAPSGATSLTSTSMINIQTVDGVTLYTANYSSTGTKSTVSVNKAGVLTSLPTRTSVTFADLPTAAQTELQAIATAKGVTTTIDSTTKVTKLVESNGTVLYTIRLAATSTTDSTKTYPIALTVDAAANPTVAAGGFGGGGGGGGAC